MNEAFLHYIWHYQLFNKKELKSVNGEGITIQKHGTYTQKSGPDFTEAHIEINGQLWVGTVEIHLKSSDWYAHHHETDAHYNNVILHVVWEHDVDVFRLQNQPITTLELKGLVPQFRIENYNRISQIKPQFIPCERFIGDVNPIVWTHFSERLYLERLQRKSAYIHQLLNQTQYDWEWTYMLLLVRAFGTKTNADVFM